MNDDIDGMIDAERLRADIAFCARLFDGGVDAELPEAELAPDIDKGFMRADRIAADDDPFDETVGIELHDRAIFKCPRLTLIAVDDEVDLLAGLWVQETPFDACGEASAASSADVALFHLVADLLGAHRRERLPGHLIGAGFFGDGEGMAIF